MNGGGEGVPIIVYSETSPTLFGAVRKTSQKVSRQLFFAHSQIVIIGEELAKEGIDPLFDFLDRAPELRLNSKLLVARGTDATSILKMLTPLEDISAEALNKRVDISSSIFGKTINVNIADTIKKLMGEGEPSINGIQIVGHPSKGIIKSNLEQTELGAYLQLKGIALFKDGKLASWIDGDEEKGTLRVLNEMDGTVDNIACEGIKEGIAIELVNSKTDIQVKVKDGQPVFSIHIREEGDIVESQCPIDMSTREALIKLQTQWEELTKENVLKAVSDAKSKKSDIFGFATELERAKPSEWAELKKDWPDIFAEVEVSVKVEAFIRRIGMRVNPHHLKE
jgi:spore germination protein KC